MGKDGVGNSHLAEVPFSWAPQRLLCGGINERSLLRIEWQATPAQASEPFETVTSYKAATETSLRSKTCVGELQSHFDSDEQRSGVQ